MQRQTAQGQRVHVFPSQNVLTAKWNCNSSKTFLRAKGQRNAKQAHVVSFLSEANKEPSTRVPSSKFPFPGRAGFDLQSVTAPPLQACPKCQHPGREMQRPPKQRPWSGFRAGKVSGHTGKRDTVTICKGRALRWGKDLPDHSQVSRALQNTVTTTQDKQHTP